MSEPAPRYDYGFGPGPERWITRVELAEIMGVSVRTIDRLIKAGMPSVTWGRRTRRLKASEAIAWATEHGNDADTLLDRPGCR